jgi:hypothetical protein
VQSSLFFYQNLRDDNESKMTIVHFLGQEKGIKKIATNVDENHLQNTFNLNKDKNNSK